MRRIETLADAQIVIRELLDFKTKIETSGLDLHGLRVRNAGAAEKAGDYITYEQMQDLLTKINDVEAALQNLKGLTVTVEQTASFIVGGAAYTKMIFQDGILRQYA